MPGFEVTSWQGLCTQAAVPPSAEMRKRLADQAFHPHYLPADQFAAFARAERARWANNRGG